MTVYLSPHFTLEEIVRSSTAARLGIDNTPPPEAVLALKIHADSVLEPIRSHLGAGIRIVSGYRCAALNSKTSGSSRTSQHTCPNGKAAATDILPLRELSPLAFAELILGIHGLPFDQCILEYFDPNNEHTGWVHISSVLGRDPRRQVLTIDRRGVRPGLDPIKDIR